MKVSKVLTRGRSGNSPEPRLCTCRRVEGEAIVAKGLSMTPSDIERLARQGIAVSTPAADSFRYDGSDGWTVDPVYLRDSDRNSLWELSKVSKDRILQARQRDKSRYT